MMDKVGNKQSCGNREIKGRPENGAAHYDNAIQEHGGGGGPTFGLHLLGAHAPCVGRWPRRSAPRAMPHGLARWRPRKKHASGDMG